MIACDLDGTLLNSSAQVSARSAAALLAAKRAGIHVVLASGRPPFMLEPIIGTIDAAVSYGVLANGSIVCSLPDGAALREINFEVAVAAAVVTQLRNADSGFGFAMATDAGFAHEPGFSERMPAPQPMPPSPDALAAAQGATKAIKLMVFHREHGAHQLLDLLPPMLGEHVSVTHMGANCVEIGPAGIDKATALSWLCAHIGIDAADVVAFGDEYNDHEMLRWAGRGIAMGNANDLTKSIADEVTESNDDDGVAVAIERLLAERL